MFSVHTVTVKTRKILFLLSVRSCLSDALQPLLFLHPDSTSSRLFGHKEWKYKRTNLSCRHEHSYGQRERSIWWFTGMLWQDGDERWSDGSKDWLLDGWMSEWLIWRLNLLLGSSPHLMVSALVALLLLNSARRPQLDWSWTCSTRCVTSELNVVLNLDWKSGNHHQQPQSRYHQLAASSQKLQLS